MSLKKIKTAKIALGTLAVAMAFSLSVSSASAAALTQSQVDAIISLLKSFGADAGTVANVQASLTGGTPSSGGSSSVGAYNFAADLTMGSSGADVVALQKLLNGSADTQVAASGVGSSGNESSYFGSLTRSAVIKFQKKYGISPAVGYFGPATRAKANSMGGGSSSSSGTSTPAPAPAPAGTGLSISGATQPAASLAPQSANRVPFTKFTLTAGNDGDVTVNSVTVQRTGLGNNAVFAGVVLLDEAGVQIGVAKTLNSNDQVLVGDPFTVKKGTSRVITVAGNMASDLSSYAGQVVSLSVVGVNTSATVTGSLPIAGAGHTINSTLSLGSVTTAISTFDPVSSQTKNVGDTSIKFTGLRVTAGSAEKLRLWSIRWNQTGSVGSGDLANIVTVVDGVEYPTTVSSDGKYYTSTFGAGLVIDKGLSKDVYVKGDLVGSSAANRKAQFDIYKTTDVYMTGETFGYGVTPAAGSSSVDTDGTSNTAITSGTPWFQGSTFSINAGTATTINKATSVAAQNIAVNVPNQVLGGFETDIKGEPISVQSMVFTTATSSTGTGVITNVSIYDENGAVVAGPVDGSSLNNTFTFSDTVTFPVGKKVWTLKGKLPSGMSDNNGGTIIVSTVPSSGWTNITGQVTGNTITLSNGSFAMNTMTIKAAALAVGVSPSPAAQTIVAGGTSRILSTYQFDASQSGEDVRFSAVTLDSDLGNNAKAASIAQLTSCQLWDGSTALNTGSNVVNPSTTATTTAGVDMAITFDQALIVPKGTVKALDLKCFISSTTDTNGVFQFGISNTNATGITATGVVSSASVSPTSTTGADQNGQAQTIGAGSFVVSTDASSPSYTFAAAGSSANVVGVYKFHANNEAINLQKIGLILTNSASSTASDILRVTLWDGTTQVGSASFVGTNLVATSTLTSTVMIPKDGDKVITAKVDFNPTLTGTGGAATGAIPGHVVAVDVNANDTTGTEGSGSSSGSTINLATTGSSASTAVAGARLFKSFPTITKLSVPSTKAVNGDSSLLRFRVTANSTGDIGIAQFTVRIATTTMNAASLNIYAYTDSGFSVPVSGLSADGSMLATALDLSTDWVSNATDLSISAQTSAAASTTVQVPAGASRYFDVRATLSNVGASGDSIATQIQGDAAYPSLSTFMANFNSIDDDTNDDFIWSPNSTTTVGTAGFDWTNGFGVVGLPSSNMNAEILSF